MIRCTFYIVHDTLYIVNCTNYYLSTEFCSNGKNGKRFLNRSYLLYVTIIDVQLSMNDMIDCN